jgi:hypothetical protein
VTSSVLMAELLEPAEHPIYSSRVVTVQSGVRPVTLDDGRRLAWGIRGGGRWKNRLLK